MLLWAGLAHGAAADTVRISADDYRAILKRLDALQTRVDSMESQPANTAAAPARAKAAPAAPQSTVDKVDRMAEDINNIYDTLDQVETKTLKDRVNVGAEYRLRYDSYQYKNLRILNNNGQNATQQSQWNNMVPLAQRTTGAEDRSRDNDDNNWTNRFRINMDASISKSLKFHARLAAMHAWGDNDENTVANYYSQANAAQRQANNDLLIDRFYIDWIPQGSPIPLAVTVGRHPSSEGPPLEFKENRKRQSTYPGIIIDTQMDGIVLTLGLERYIGLKNAGLRFGYGIGYHSDMNSTNMGFLDDNSTKDMKIGATFFESEIPMVPNSLMVFSFVRVEDMVTSAVEQGNYTIGNENFYGAHFQVADIVRSGLDVYASYTTNKTDPTEIATPGYPGLLTNGGTDTTSQTGWSILTGFRYKIPVQAMLYPKIGFEYNHGSKYHCSMTSGSVELYNKLATRGDAYEVYYIQPASRNLFFRTGYTYIDYKYTRSGMPTGVPADSNTEMENIYFLMDVRF